jgi:CheY-like chemotaxis protein
MDASSHPPSQSLPLLVVEDEEVSRTALAEALRAWGYGVSTAADGREALLALASLPRPCAVVLDLNMPVMDGASLVRLLRQQGALDGVGLVALTGNEYVPEDLPFAAVLAKPLQLPVLLRVLQELRAGPAAAPRRTRAAPVQGGADGAR